MTNTITVSTGAVDSKEIAPKQLLEKKEDIYFLKSRAISKVTLIFEVTTESKPIMLRKLADNYAEEEFG
jgi:hypothetical protein